MLVKSYISLITLHRLIIKLGNSIQILEIRVILISPLSLSLSLSLCFVFNGSNIYISSRWIRIGDRFFHSVQNNYRIIEASR